MSNILSSFLSICFIFILTLFFIRCIIYLTIYILSKFYSINKNKIKRKKLQPKTNIVIYKKEEDELFRDEKLENLQKKLLKNKNIEDNNKESEKQVKIINNDNNITTTQNIEIINKNQNDKIVGILKPIGFWTSLVIGDQLSKIFENAKVIKKRSGKGFWVSMLEAQRKISEKNNNKSPNINM